MNTRTAADLLWIGIFVTAAIIIFLMPDVPR